jgi:microcystin degradation protein MlrC
MTFTVLTAEFSHETNTFSILPTDYAAFANRSILFGNEAIEERRHSNTDIAGFIDVAEARGWTVIHALSASAPPGGCVTHNAFERLTNPILALVSQHSGKLDGIALGLHGAMVPDFCEDGEGELLARLRTIIGPELPIAITLDPHANVTRRMCELANIIVSYKTYPHVDIRETGRHAAEILHGAMAGDIRPVTIRAHRPMLEEINSGRTDIGPMIGRHAATSKDRMSSLSALMAASATRILPRSGRLCWSRPRATWPHIWHSQRASPMIFGSAASRF